MIARRRINHHDVACIMILIFVVAVIFCTSVLILFESAIEPNDITPSHIVLEFLACAFMLEIIIIGVVVYEQEHKHLLSGRTNVNG